MIRGRTHPPAHLHHRSTGTYTHGHQHHLNLLPPLLGYSVKKASPDMQAGRWRGHSQPQGSEARHGAENHVTPFCLLEQFEQDSKSFLLSINHLLFNSTKREVEIYGGGAGVGGVHRRGRKRDQERQPNRIKEGLVSGFAGGSAKSGNNYHLFASSFGRCETETLLPPTHHPPEYISPG